MATIVETIEREDGHKIAIYESGAEYDLTIGRLVTGAKRTQFNQETSMQAVERRVELKREAVLRGAARALDKTEWDMPNDLDVVEAISEAVTIKALDPDNPKQVDAARFILQESRLSESQPSSSVPASNFAALGSDFAAIAQSMARIISDVLQAKADAAPLHDTIDGKILD